MLFLLKAVILLTVFNVNTWQQATYSNLSHTITSPSYPSVKTFRIDRNSLTFTAYAAVKDPRNKYFHVMHDIKSLPDWLFLMRYNGIKNELWHRGWHFSIPCNVFRDNKLLLHIKTVGFFSTDIIFQIFYSIEDTRLGIVGRATIDNSLRISAIRDFNIIFWTFPHPTIKGLVIVVLQGYIKTAYDVGILDNNIKWHIDNVLQNFGERLVSDIND